MAVGVQTQIETPVAGAVARWSLPHRVAFRFACCYLLLYMAPDPPGRFDLIDVIPGGSFIGKAYGGLWHKLVPWVAIHVFHLTGKVTTYFPTGSGDTTLDYIQNLLFVVFAALATIVWSAIDYRRTEYRRLHSWLRLAVRYTLAFTMFGYGLDKVFPLQFRFPGFQKLVEPYGEFSPMGVLWYFMGASTAYTIFGGLSEVCGGALLLFRRTVSLGAMVSFAVLLNIVMMNFCYDVPVKLYSTNLLLMAVFLLLPDLRRLVNFLVLNRAAGPVDLSPPRFEHRRLRIASVVFQVLFVGYFLYGEISGGWKAYRQTYVHPQRPALYGLYDVEAFTLNGRELPPLLTDNTRWRRVLVQSPASIGIQMMDGWPPKNYTAAYDASRNSVTLTPPGSKDKNVFTYSRPDADHVILSGDALTVKLRRLDTSKFLLVNRGFHWINELPFNR